MLAMPLDEFDQAVANLAVIECYAPIAAILGSKNLSTLIFPVILPLSRLRESQRRWRYECVPIGWISAPHFVGTRKHREGVITNFELSSPAYAADNIAALPLRRMVGKSPVKTNTNIAQHLSDDRAEYERVRTALAGKMFVPTEDMTLDCQIVNLSAGGARIQCEAPPPRHIRVVLYIEGFGRFEAITTRYVRDELGLRFVGTEEKRQRLLQDIASFINGGVTRATQLRRHVRTASTSFGYFVPSSGEFCLLQCTERLIARDVASNERTSSHWRDREFGCTRGRVVRHHENGIAIQFLGVEKPADHEGHSG